MQGNAPEDFSHIDVAVTDDVRTVVTALGVGLGLLHRRQHTLDALRLGRVNAFAVTPTAHMTNIEVRAVEVTAEVTDHAIVTVTVAMGHHHCFGSDMTGVIAVVVKAV